MKLAVLGLGKMGSRIAKKLLSGGHNVVVWNRTQASVDEFLSQLSENEKLHCETALNIKDAILKLDGIKIVWSMLPSGEATAEVLTEIEKYVKKGDIVIDGGNAIYTDTQKRFEHFKEKGIHFLGIGVSGGIIALKQGYPQMAGGDKSAYEDIKPILDTLAYPHGGHEYFGEGGAGHFVKMVHNGIEYGIMQSLGEGFEVLEKSKYKFDLLKVAKLYQKGTLVSGFMTDRVVDALEKDPHLDDIVGIIAESGEAKWTIEEARSENVDTPIIEASLDYRRDSQTSEKIQKSFTAKMVAALRNAFGGHEVKKRG